jgi:hypothetical protein
MEFPQKIASRQKLHEKVFNYSSPTRLKVGYIEGVRTS